MQRIDSNKNRRLAIILALGVLGMFGFCYLLVPIYYIVCKQTGINGKGANSVSIAPTGMTVDTSRTIKVEFSSVINGKLNFKFIPLQRRIEIHPGERKLIYYYAENQTGLGKTVQAVPSVTPIDAARFLKKTECFCFTQQFFKQSEKADMPVYFYVDPNISKDIKEMTLTYTLFDASGYEKNQPRFTKGRIYL
jgi:cytochrome c oxidase assembly protein subunit 11